MRDPVRSRTRVSAPPDTLRSALTRRATNIVLSPGAHHALVVSITPSRRARLASGRTQHIALSTLPAPGAHLASGGAQHISGNTLLSPGTGRASRGGCGVVVGGAVSWPGTRLAFGRARHVVVASRRGTRLARLLVMSTFAGLGARLASGRAQHFAGNTPGARLVGGRCRSLPRPLAGRGRGS